MSWQKLAGDPLAGATFSTGGRSDLERVTAQRGFLLSHHCHIFALNGIALVLKVRAMDDPQIILVKTKKTAPFIPGKINDSVFLFSCR